MSKFSFNFTRLIGIDLGSSFTRIWSDREGLVVNEPSWIAVDQRSNKVVAVGREAWEMRDRVGGHLAVKSPVRNGVIYDLDLARAFLKILLHKVLVRHIFSPIMMVSVPACSTKAARKMTTRLFYSLGAKDVYLIVQPLAAAIGAGIPIADASGGFILQMGGGLVEGAVVSLGSLVASRSIAKAGLVADEQIRQTLRTKHQLVVSSTTAERIKRRVGVASELVHKEVKVAGKDMTTSNLKEMMVNSGMLLEPITKLAEEYERLLKKLLSEVPPELTVDVIDKGLLLAGGWAQLVGWEEFFIERLGVPVSLVESSSEAVIEGIGAVLENLDEFRESLGYVG